MRRNNNLYFGFYQETLPGLDNIYDLHLSKWATDDIFRLSNDIPVKLLLLLKFCPLKVEFEANNLVLNAFTGVHKHSFVVFVFMEK